MTDDWGNKFFDDLKSRAEARTDELLFGYPNLSAVLDGRISGQVTEWPVIRIEIMKLMGVLAAKEAENADLKQRLKNWSCGANSCTAYKLEAEVARLTELLNHMADDPRVQAAYCGSAFAGREAVLDEVRKEVDGE